MADRNLLPIQSILNQSPSVRPRTPYSQQSGSDISSPVSDTNETSNTPGGGGGGGIAGRLAAPSKKARDSSDLSYTRPQGPIKYPPYEDLDADRLELVTAFQVHPFGQIGQWCAQISYSSDKKDVFEKTGRESFHVFVYKFIDPSNRQSYDVMWDYVGGFVRISPFFKSCKHKKTGPAKMLDLNKGLRDVSFHMTGGNRIAQGYWMPFHCARAVCTTFCYNIAGALIPIFGPTFPQECVKPDSPRFGRMAIDEQVVREAKHDNVAYKHSSLTIPRNNGITSHPRHNHHSFDSMRHVVFPTPFSKSHGSYDSRNGIDLGNSYYHSPPPTQHVPWGQETESDRHYSSRGPNPHWDSINPVARHDPLQSIHPSLRPDAYQTQSNLEAYPPMQKRGLPLDSDPQPHQPYSRQTYENTEGPYKRLRLEAPSQHQVEYPSPVERPWHAPPDTANVNPYLALGPAETSTTQPNSHDRMLRDDSNEEAQQKTDTEPEYTTEDLEVALILSGFAQPGNLPKEKPQQASRGKKKTGYRARSF